MVTKILIALVFGIVFGSGAYIGWLRRRLDVALKMLSEERSRRSLSASYGRITEQWFPLMKAYPYDSANFRFLGTPLDGVQFEDDRIVFVEFKSNRSELSAQQKRLKRLIETGKVTWEEYHFDDR